MVDNDFNEFLDSDDDAFLVEASSTFSDWDISSSEALLKAEKHIPQKQEITLSLSNFDIKKEKISLLENRDEIDSCRGRTCIHEDAKGGIKYVTSTPVVPDSGYVLCDDNFKQDTIISTFNSCNIPAPITKEYNTRNAVSSANENNFVLGTISISNEVLGQNNNFTPDAAFIESKSCSVRKDNFTPSSISASSSDMTSIVVKNSFTSDSTNVICDSRSAILEVQKDTFTPNTSSYINNRFTPGFTPKAKKRKFAGPAGLLELFDGADEEKSDICESKEIPTMANEFEHIVSSQFSPEHLLLPSWQKLQTDVSSHSSLHSAAKFYSIQRVLHESSKKKLPKHMIVPVLCVLLKEIKHKGSSTIPIFMDDTGEINGKIDAKVISKFKDCIIEGSALILMKVTFLCNVLILKIDNLVSIYLPDGTKNCLHSLESVLDTAEPLKPLNCECLKQSHQYKNSLVCAAPLRNYISGPHKTGCVDHGLKISNKTLNTKSINTERLKDKSSSTYNKLSPVKNVRNDAFLESLLSEDTCMDEFDELLGNLNEELFLGDL